jgi:hypothetical protein
MSASHALLEIAVCDNNNEILIDSDPKEQGKSFQPLCGLPADRHRQPTGWTK